MGRPAGGPLAFLVSLLLAGILAAGCAENTVEPTGDGRLFLLLEADPSRAYGSVIQIDLQIEGMDPIREVVFDQRKPPPSGGGVYIDVSESVNWLDIQGNPYDLVGEVLPGGTEIHMSIKTNQFDTNEASFTLDGNTTVRIFVANPDVPGTQHLEMELTLQQVF